MSPFKMSPSRSAREAEEEKRVVEQGTNRKRETEGKKQEEETEGWKNQEGKQERSSEKGEHADPKREGDGTSDREREPDFVTKLIQKGPNSVLHLFIHS